MFKKLVKATLAVNDNVDEIIDEMQLIRDIAKEQ
jgi:hypothetical protein